MKFPSTRMISTHGGWESKVHNQHRIQVIWALDRLAEFPDTASITTWAAFTLDQQTHELKELTIKIVTSTEITALNQLYRHQQAATNVLAFPLNTPMDSYQFLGDIAICAEIVSAEALTQGKPTQAHFAHMVVHGVLHLLGNDHQSDITANKMERIEIKILQQLGFPNPYCRGCDA